ncbi:MAG TPA: DUF4286 family protein [Woeseiaceae bacterium]
MQKLSGPIIYEVTLDIGLPAAEDGDGEAGTDPASEADAWLDEHNRQMLELPGFLDAATYRVNNVGADSLRYVTHYQVESGQALDDYLAGPATDMRRATEDHFGERVTASRRILRPGPSGAPEATETCANCATPLAGQYCSRCGQRARSRLISIWELVRDAIGDLFELDSRIWQTLIPLVFRPGKLTRDYLMGRRARFMPPFRTYLVLSLLFFLVAFFDPQQQLGIFFEPPDPSVAANADTDASASEVREEVLDELRREGIIAGPQESEPANDSDAEEDTPAAGIRITPDDDAVVNCDLEGFSLDGAPEWLSRRFTRDRVQAVCEKVSADSGQAFLNQLLDNVPVALFVLLPLMALVLKMLFPLSKRYYAEHLLFVLHFHAFFFLILTIQVVVSRLATRLPIPEAAANLTILVLSLYIPVYLYKAMRRVYEQGRLIMLLKYVLLVFAYVLGFAFILLIAAFYTAFSI